MQISLDLLDPHDLAAHRVEEGFCLLQARRHHHLLLHGCQQLLDFRAPWSRQRIFCNERVRNVCKIVQIEFIITVFIVKITVTSIMNNVSSILFTSVMRALNLIIMTWHFYCTNILTPTDGNSSWCPTGLPIANALKLAQARRLPQKPLDQWPAHIFVSDDDNIDDHDDDDIMTTYLIFVIFSPHTQSLLKFFSTQSA